jgi:hypothetical protein
LLSRLARITQAFGAVGRAEYSGLNIELKGQNYAQHLITLQISPSKQGNTP